MNKEIYTFMAVAVTLGAFSALPANAQDSTSAAAAQATGAPRVIVNHQRVMFQGQPPIEQNGHLLVPLRGVLEKLDAYVNFDSATQTVVAFRGHTRITLPIGSQQAQVNGHSVSLDVPAQVVNGSTLVPLRFVAEALGAHVSFDVSTNTVDIHTHGMDSMGAAAMHPGDDMRRGSDDRHANDMRHGDDTTVQRTTRTVEVQRTGN